MSKYSVPPKGKLSFKGEKQSKKKRKRKAQDSFEDDTNQEGWVITQSLNEMIGPLNLIFNTEPLCSLHYSEKNHCIDLLPLPDQNLATTEPQDVSCVFVCAHIVGSVDKISLKTYDGKYVSSDRFGVISADKEAIGPQEEWLPIVRSDGVALQNSYDMFLSVDEIAGGGFKLRADAETIGFCETWQIKCQAKFKKRQKIDTKETKAVAIAEVETVKKYQTWGGGRIKMTGEDMSNLKKAKKEGNFHETLLDRREKVKADRYCK